MDCPEVMGQVGAQSTLAIFLTVQLVLQTFPEVSLSHSLTCGTIGATRTGRLLAPCLHEAARRLHKLRREGVCGSSARPLYSTKITESPEYTGSGCEFKSTDMKSVRRNHNFNFLQAQKTRVFLTLDLRKMKGVRSRSLPLTLRVLLGSSDCIISLRTAK